MNMQAADSVEALESAMADLIGAIKERGEIDTILLDETQEAWKIFATKEAELHASLVSGGSMYSMIWGNTKAEEIRRRIETLRWWIEKEEGDL
ncbi:lysozyme inhibitor LprI family protein [Neorhizobium galegae]|nr:lysozyme inhibitor LprI family protein [Neorhizobium galegae]